MKIRKTVILQKSKEDENENRRYRGLLGNLKIGILVVEAKMKKKAKVLTFIIK